MLARHDFSIGYYWSFVDTKNVGAVLPAMKVRLGEISPPSFIDAADAALLPSPLL